MCWPCAEFLSRLAVFHPIVAVFDPFFLLMAFTLVLSRAVTGGAAPDRGLPPAGGGRRRDRAPVPHRAVALRTRRGKIGRGHGALVGLLDL
jgi:hypothetical protein